MSTHRALSTLISRAPEGLYTKMGGINKTAETKKAAPSPSLVKNTKFIESNIRILVTGGAGFIGSHLVVDKLMENERNEVIVADNYFTGSKDNIKKWIGHPIFELIFLQKEKITPSVLSERLRINGSLARRAIKDLIEKGAIKVVCAHSSQQIYTRATKEA